MMTDPLNLAQLVANTRGNAYEFRADSQANAQAVYDS